MPAPRKVPKEDEARMAELKKLGTPVNVIAESFGVSKQLVSYILNGRKWNGVNDDTDYESSGLFDVDRYFKSDFIYQSR
jgi:hypothetical protein